MTMPMATTIKLAIIIIIVTERTDLEIERMSACQCGQGLRRLLYLQQGRQLGSTWSHVTRAHTSHHGYKRSSTRFN